MLLGGGWPRGGWSAFKEGTEGLSFADRTSSALSSRVLTRPSRLRDLTYWAVSLQFQRFC